MLRSYVKLDKSKNPISCMSCYCVFVWCIHTCIHNWSHVHKIVPVLCYSTLYSLSIVASSKFFAHNLRAYNITV